MPEPVATLYAICVVGGGNAGVGNIGNRETTHKCSGRKAGATEFGNGGWCETAAVSDDCLPSVPSRPRQSSEMAI